MVTNDLPFQVKQRQYTSCLLDQLCLAMAGVLYVLSCALPNGSLRGCDFGLELHYVDESLLYQQCSPSAARDDGNGTMCFGAVHERECEFEAVWPLDRGLWMPVKTRGGDPEQGKHFPPSQAALCPAGPSGSMRPSGQRNPREHAPRFWGRGPRMMAWLDGDACISSCPYVIGPSSLILLDDEGFAEENGVQVTQHVYEDDDLAESVPEGHAEGIDIYESDGVVLMQRKRRRSPSPRRRRRGREQRVQNRSRQENRLHWTRGPASAPVTSTSSTARVPWRRGPGTRLLASRPSSAPPSVTGTCAGTSSAATPIPRLTGEGSGNILWWGEIVGLQDPMEEQETILPPEVADNKARNLQEMSESQRTHMVAQIVPFLAAFLAELLRAVNLGFPVNVDDQEEGEESGMLQLDIIIRDGRDMDATSFMQGAMPTGRFGGLLQQLQSHLEGQDLAQQQQATAHLAKLLVHLRRLAGDLTPQLADRFARLEALLACFRGEDVDVPLAMQLWAEGQLRRLAPLMGGAAPLMVEETAAPAEVMTIEDSLPSGEVMIKRGLTSPWEPASEEERRELAAHEAQVREDEERQHKHDEYLLACQDAAKAQDYEDWAVTSEMDRRCPQPSRKRVRVAVCVSLVWIRDWPSGH